ncbi:flagellar hook-basal body complex protein [Actibacterium lipolyticum]|uniref:Flagellar basal-body rod protein FlgF n=1 Tax=Actibacterium lipolyticum TaxID=1524263 RepID=A0A238KXL4_9RHOB|nr:flagellar hook-basal body complex protein [Actibacterium lipolyticum]SMX47428.1 Flagellar basal-body rod protein FlgG [Actibacterium lipolyticum]
MDNAGYTTLTRQAGLLREMQSVANNIANLSTTGYRGEGMIFAEHVRAVEGPSGSLSMASANVRNVDLQQGPLTETGGTFDFAIEGPGFFLIETPNGERLTRAGAFTPNEAGELATPDGYRLLDLGGAPIFIPPDAASVQVSPDGTLSADGRALSQVGVYSPASAADLSRDNNTSFAFQGELEPISDSSVLQGFVENSNVDPITEVARMIEVQHAYQLGQSFLEREDERIRGVLRTLGQ